MNYQDNFYLKVESNKFFKRNFFKEKKTCLKIGNVVLRKSKNEVYKILKK